MSAKLFFPAKRRKNRKNQSTFRFVDFPQKSRILQNGFHRISAPQTLPISSLVPLESLFRKLSNGPTRDTGSARRATISPTRNAQKRAKSRKSRIFANLFPSNLCTTDTSDIEPRTVGKLMLQAFQRFYARYRTCPWRDDLAGSKRAKPRNSRIFANFFAKILETNETENA